MARFYGEVGYGESVETPTGSGVMVDQITEQSYYGDIIRNTRVLETGDQANPDIITSNSISIVANAYAIRHFINIKYVRWAGVLWTVTNVEVRSPRIILTLGGVYNGPTP